MIIKKSELVAVTGNKSQYPPEDMWEIAFVGRSNVGKSSLLNLLTGRRKLAKVSSSPGKTRTINFYQINDEFRIVDLPGYGYAKVSKSLSQGWEKMIKDYLEGRPNLAKVIQLVDIRHDPTELDIKMQMYLRSLNLDGVVVATKSDKISRNHLQKQISNIRNKLSLERDDIVVPVSSLKKNGIDDVLNVIQDLLWEDEDA